MPGFWQFKVWGLGVYRNLGLWGWGFRVVRFRHGQEFRCLCSYSDSFSPLQDGDLGAHGRDMGLHQILFGCLPLPHKVQKQWRPLAACSLGDKLEKVYL